MALANKDEGRKLLGGTLYVEGVTVTVARDNLVLDVILEDIDEQQLETLIVKIGSREVASIPI